MLVERGGWVDDRAPTSADVDGDVHAARTAIVARAVAILVRNAQLPTGCEKHVR
jgi:hypothetical protein